MLIAYNNYMRKRTYYTSANLNPVLKKINDILIEQDLSPSSVSIMAGLGSSTLSNLLKRNNIPTLATLYRVCAVFGIEVWLFLKNLDETHPDLFLKEKSSVQRYDPNSKLKDQIYDNWNALPLRDKEETVQRMLAEYAKPDIEKQ